MAENDDAKMVGKLEKEEALLIHRAKRKGCYIKLILGWLVLGAVVVFLMVFIRSRVERDPEKIREAVVGYFDFTLPDGFEPYSMNDFWGVTLAVFNDANNTREDGRTLAIIALNRDVRHKNKTLDEVKDDLFSDLEKRLNKREFKVKSKRVETLEVDGQMVEIHVFSGIHLIDEDYVDATNCYRFVVGKDGPMYLHTMGLNGVFSEKAQCEALAAFKVK